MADRSYGFNVFALAKGFEQVGRQVDKLGRTLEAFDRKTAKATLDVETRKAEEKVGQFARNLQQRVERAVRSLPDIKLGADASPVDRRIAEIRRELATLSSKRIGVDVDAGQAQARINQLSTELARLSTRSPNIQVRADTAAASAALLGVSAVARRVDGQNVVIGVNASDVSRAISLIGLLTAGLAGVAAAAAPAAAALAALPALGGAAAQGIGALAAGFSGVGDAVKALQQEETKAAAGTAASAASRANSAQAIASAQRQVERAVIAADRAQIQGAQQVEDARRGLADAYAQGARQIAQAERQVLQAQRAVTDAQLDLNRARADAIERNEDLGLSLRDVAIGEREALLDLREAQQRLAEGQSSGVSGDELERLQIGVERAQLSLDQTRERFGDLRQESDEYARSGIEGSREVVAAQRQVADAVQGVRDAEAARAEAAADSARQVADAQRQLARAQQQASWAQQDAADAVADAQRALSNAYTDAGNVGATSANKVKEAMEGLSPEAQKFARFLSSQVIPGLHGVRDAIQATLLPRMETALRNLGGLAPIVSDGLAETGKVIGDLSVKGSEMMSSGPWRRDFAAIMASNNRSLESFGGAGLSLVDVFRSISVAAGPMVERFAQFVETASQAFDSFITGARATGELDRFFAQMSDTLAELGHVCGQIITAFVQLAQAMGPFGMILLRTVGDLVELIGNLAAANPLLTQLAAAALVGVAAFNKIGAAIQGMTLAAGVAISGWKTLGGLMAGLAPAAVAARLGGLQRGIEAASLSAGVMTERLTHSASAGEKVATAGGKVATAATKIGGALPIVGAAVIGLAIAYDQLSSAAGESAAKLLQGGQAAADQAQNLRENDLYIHQVRDSWFKYIPVVGQVALGIAAAKTSTEEATQAMREQLAAMTPLQQAQTLAGQAAKNYGKALKDHGPDSWQAATAAGALALATDRVEQEQRQAEDATKSLTERLRDQRDQMLGNIDASIRYEGALDAVTESVQNNGRSTDITTAAGRANMSALNDMARSAAEVTDRMIAQGASQDQVSAKSRTMRDQIYQAALQIGYTREEARRYADQLNLTPRVIRTEFIADTGGALGAIWRFRDDVNRAMVEIRDADIRVQFADTGNIMNYARYATGGPIYGPGTETSDSIPARLSRGEHVWTAREVHGAGGHSNVARLRKLAASGRIPGYAAGGPVLNEDVAVRFHAQGLDQVRNDYGRFVADAANQSFGGSTPGPGGAVERWRPVGLRALAIAGQSAMHINRLLMQMRTESGGRPDAVNLWDVNAQRGYPSTGLMQVIRPTYQAYRHPAYDRGPYMYGVSIDPLANILASTRYTLARYGSLPAGWQGHGYDQGGIWRSGSIGWNASGRPERVLSPRQTEAFERLTQVLGTLRGSMPLVVSGGQQAALSGAVKLAGPELAALGAAIEQALQRAMPSLDGLKMQIIDDGRGGLARITRRQGRTLNREGWSGR